jgi:hypothetical protein
MNYILPVVCRRYHVFLRLVMSNILSYDMSLRFESRVVMFATSFGMFGTSLLPVVCGRTHVFFTLCVFVCI